MDTKHEFKTTYNGQEVSLSVLAPSAKVQNDASLVYSTEWGKASRPLRDNQGNLVRPAAPLRAEIENSILPEHPDIWNDSCETQKKDLQMKLLDSERRLAGGANEFNTLEDAVGVAYQMRKDRFELNKLLLRKSSLDDNSAESYAETARLNYLIFACTVYSDGKKFFNNLDDYYARVNEKSTADAATSLLKLMNGASMDFINKTPENEFLRDYGYLDEQYRRINKDGHLTDDDGRLIDAEGYYVNKHGDRVDIKGHRINDKGEYIADFKDFVDKEGNIIKKVR